MLYLIKCYNKSIMLFPLHTILELCSGKNVEVVKPATNPAMILVSDCDQPKSKPYAIWFSNVNKLVSSPLPIEMPQEDPDDVHQTQNVKRILDRSPKQNNRGGKREGAGRPSTGNPPKKRKALQLDYAIAQRLPDLKMLSELIEEFRPIAESGALRSLRLADFYKKLDALPKIVND